MIIITGTMGAGKTTVMAEASDILAAAEVVHAAIDLDVLAVAHLPEEHAPDIAYRNLASVWSNYEDAGVTRLLLAAAMESNAVLTRIRDAIPDAEIVVCRLTVDIPTAEGRVRTREPGMFQNKFTARVAELERILNAAQLENFCIHNDDNGSVTNVAREMLTRDGWL
jgi:shikimate kinase